MKFKYLFIVLFLLGSCCVFANQIRVNSYPGGIKVTIDNPATSVINLPGKKSSIAFADGENVDPMSKETGYSLPGYRFLFAVPDADRVEAVIANVTERYLNTINLASYNDIYKDSQEKFPDNKSSVNHYIKIEKAGRVRGIDLVLLIVQPFDYNPQDGELYVTGHAEIDINFNSNVPLVQANIPANQLSVFEGVDNREHLPYLVLNAADERVKRPANPEVLSVDWYNKDRHYIRISTTRDGIARVKMSDLINIDQSLNGKQPKNLHLVFKGAEYPAYITNDQGTINSGQEILFLGKRAAGDTTWLDNYTWEAVFYTYYDEASPGARLKVLPSNLTAASDIRAVTINRHIQYDQEYFWGKYLDFEGTTTAEGWYWKLLDQNKNNQFIYDNFITPTGDAADFIRFDLNYTVLMDTVIDGSKRIPLSYINRFYVNGDSTGQTGLGAIVNNTISLNKPGNVLFSGMNRIKLLSVKADSLSLNRTGVMYLNITGNVFPNAWQGNSEFSIDRIQNNSKLTVPGFSSQQVLLLDKTSNSLGFPKVEAGTTFHTGGKGGDQPFAELIINDSSRTSQQKGMHIAYRPSPDFTAFGYVYSKTASGDTKSFIDSLPSGSIISVVYNGDAELDSDTKTLFASQGSTLVNAFSSGQAWVYTWRKEVGKFGEKVSDQSTISGFIAHTDGKSYRSGMVLPGGNNYDIVMEDNSIIERCGVNDVSTSDLHNIENGADALIISHKNFLHAAQRLADHRREYEGLNAKVIDVNNIYKEFYYGRKSPHAIREFLKYAVNTWKVPPTHVVMFGNPSWDPRNILSNKRIDYVPTYGYPVSDYWYGLVNDPKTNELIVGRLPVSTEAEAESLVDKLIGYDNTPLRPWMKNFLWMSGGLDDIEREFFYSARMVYFLNFVAGPEVCADTFSIRKRDNLNVGASEASQIIDRINGGVMWTSFLGHAAPEVFDMDGWQVDKLNNQGRIGVLSTLSCNVGDFGNPFSICRNSTYLMAPDRGFIGTTGSTGTGNTDVDGKILYTMMMAFSDTSRNVRSLGDLLYAGKSKLYFKSWGESRGLYQYSLVGDPFTKIKIATKPDLYLVKQLISYGAGSSQVISENDTNVTFTGIIYNGGICDHNPFDMILTREYEGRIDTLRIFYNELCLREGFRFDLPVMNMPGKHRVKLIVDPLENVADPDRSNNIVEFEFEVYTAGLLALDPLPFHDVNAGKPVFRYINPFAISGNFDYLFTIYNLKDTLSQPVMSSTISELTTNEAFIQWNPAGKLTAGQTYWIAARMIDHGKANKQSSLLWIPFHATAAGGGKTVDWVQASRDHLGTDPTREIDIKTKNDSTFVQLKERTLQYYSLGVTGLVPPGKRWSQIWVSNIDDTTGVSQDVYVNTEYSRGFNVVRISMFTGKGIFRHYDTWEDMTSSAGMVQFLRDSVSIDDYVLIATNDRSFRVPYLVKKTDPGYIDSLKTILKTYGSALTDSLVRDVTFSMLGWKGAEVGSIPEAVSMVGDTALVKGNLTIYSKSGSLQTPLVGPAKKWRSLDLAGSLFDTSSTESLILIGCKNSNSQGDTLVKGSNINHIDLDTIDPGQYPYLKLDLNLEKTGRNAVQYLNGINFSFDPSPEFSILKSRTVVSPDSVMRGEEAVVSVYVRNISLRTLSDSSELKVSVSNNQGQIEDHFMPAGPIEPDSIKYMSITLSSDKFRPVNILNINFDDKELANELYRFNNSDLKHLSLFEDTKPPEIVVLMDGKEVHDKDYVSIQPHVAVHINDNSPLRITDPKKFRIRINGYIQDSTNSANYMFQPNPGRDNPKLVVSFVPDSLDIGENSVQVTSEDATGNKTTLTMIVKVALNGSITEVKNLPNPFGINTTLSFYYTATANGGNALVDIYNSIGQSVRKLEIPVTIGQNIIPWDGSDNSGFSLPAGAYYYRIRVDSPFFIEPAWGSCMKGR